jgi:pimeloyl-ACP methyl ester carboxylesterase
MIIKNEAELARAHPCSWRSAALGTAREVELPGGTVRYHERGGGPPIVFVHGYLVNANLWRKLVPLLAGSYRCLTVDWPLGSHVVPVRRDTDLSPHGIATLIGDFIAALELDDVVLWGNDSGGAYAQLAVATRPERIARLILNSCETPGCSWPPRGFELNRWMAVHPAVYALLFQALRAPWSWRLPRAYGRLTKRPIASEVMRGYVRPAIERADIRHDGRKAIGAVSERYSRAAAEVLADGERPPTLLLWGAEDDVFAPARAAAYAERLGAPLLTVPDSSTYTPEDAPEASATLASGWLAEAACVSS